jgi:hypothetical protein
MDFTDDELGLILAGLFELTITYVEDDEKRERCKALAAQLGDDPEACSSCLDATAPRPARRGAVSGQLVVSSAVG